MTKKHILYFLFGLSIIFSACTKQTATTKGARSTLPSVDANHYEKLHKKQKKGKQKKVKVAATKNAFAEARKKEYHKQAKLSSKPQYNDPMYFGHKKKPKKRKKGKRKFCKECGIVH